MKYKLLLLDIDGTLRPGSCERVPKENAEAVCAVQKAGVKIAIATGRGRIGVGKGLLRSIRPDYWVCAGGAQLVDYKGADLALHRLTTEEMYALVDFFEDYDLPLRFTYHDANYAYLGYEEFARREREKNLALNIVDGEDQDKHLEEMPFGIGFHPGFTVPFDDKHTLDDYELRFEKMESPLCINNLPHGLMHGNFYYLGSNIIALPINEALFANDSHCMTNLTSKTLGIYEKDTGRAVACDIGDFPYTLIWSMPGGDPKFVCIEPWHSLPSPERSSTDWLQKPAAAILAPGESWSTTLRTRFQR